MQPATGIEGLDSTRSGSDQVDPDFTSVGFAQQVRAALGRACCGVLLIKSSAVSKLYMTDDDCRTASGAGARAHRRPGGVPDSATGGNLRRPAFGSGGRYPVLDGRRLGQAAGSTQYAFRVESALNLPDDSPGDLHVPGRWGQPLEATIVAIDGLQLTLSVAEDLGEYVSRATLQSDLTFLLRTLIQRVESFADRVNPAGDRLSVRLRPRASSRNGGSRG